MYEGKVPVTWERETKKFVFDVRQMELKEGKWLVHSRLFDAKVAKKEIELVEEAG